LKEFSKQVGDHALQLGRIQGKLRQLVIRQEVKSQSLFLKASRPQAANIGEALVDVARRVMHFQAAGFEGAVGEEILNELLQALAAGLHVAQDFPLTLAQGPSFSLCSSST